MSVTEQENRFPSASKEEPAASPARFSAAFFITFFIMFGIWILLSGKFDGFHISLGLISCFIVAFFSTDLLLPSPRLKKMPGLWLRFIKYIPWLIYQVFVANIHVMYLVFHPRMMELIDPRIMGFKSRLKTDMSLVTLANSITLTPGTITIYISIYGDVTFHVIDIESGKTLPFIMDARIAEVFDE
jgi:multicomponent Na+:H+ antiporter subunit E